jgi:hypothetical protein
LIQANSKQHSSLNARPALGPFATCYNRFVRWRQAGVWDAATRRFNASPKTVAKWVGRFRRHGVEGLRDGSSRPSFIVQPNSTCRSRQGSSPLRRQCYTGHDPLSRWASPAPPSAASCKGWGLANSSRSVRSAPSCSFSRLTPRSQSHRAGLRQTQDTVAQGRRGSVEAASRRHGGVLVHSFKASQPSIAPTTSEMPDMLPPKTNVLKRQR